MASSATKSAHIERARAAQPMRAESRSSAPAQRAFRARSRSGNSDGGAADDRWMPPATRWRGATFWPLGEKWDVGDSAPPLSVGHPAGDGGRTAAEQLVADGRSGPAWKPLLTGCACEGSREHEGEQQRPRREGSAWVLRVMGEWRERKSAGGPAGRQAFLAPGRPVRRIAVAPGRARLDHPWRPHFHASPRARRRGPQSGTARSGRPDEGQRHRRVAQDPRLQGSGRQPRRPSRGHRARPDRTSTAAAK